MVSVDISLRFFTGVLQGIYILSTLQKKEEEKKSLLVWRKDTSIIFSWQLLK